MSQKGLEVAKNVKTSKFEGSWSELEGIVCFRRHSWAKCVESSKEMKQHFTGTENFDI